MMPLMIVATISLVIPILTGCYGAIQLRYEERAGNVPHFSRILPSGFGGLLSYNLTVQLGGNAYLPCRIKNLGNKAVSWIRQRDSHILTVDRYTFISDERFQSWYELSTQTWTLHIRFVQKRDAGTYECQVSTEPKISSFINVHVVKPEVGFGAERDIYVRSGSSVSLNCSIRQAVERPPYVFWYKNKTRIIDGVQGHYISTVMETHETIISMLKISSVSQRHSGNYTCEPGNLDSALVTLHVLAGEHPAAMQHSNTNDSSNLHSYVFSTMSYVVMLTFLSAFVKQLQ